LVSLKDNIFVADTDIDITDMNKSGFIYWKLCVISVAHLLEIAHLNM